MTSALSQSDSSGVKAAVRSSRTSLLRRLLAHPTGLVSSILLTVFVVVAVLARVIAPLDPDRADALNVLAAPGGAHLLGTDASGHDVWSRLLVASQVSLAGAALAALVAAVLGISTGLLAGYYGRYFESVFSWIAGLLMALPGVVVLLAAGAVLGPSVWTAMLIFGVLLAPAFYRVVYSAVSSVRNELYVDAARVSGLGDGRIITRHVLSVVRAPAIILAANIAGIAIAIQAGLGFVGLGDSAVPTWGTMLNDGFANIYTSALVVWPSLAIGITCIALVLLGNALRDVLERAGGGRRRRRGKPSAAVAASEPVIVHDEQADRPRGEELLRVENLAVGYDQPDGDTKVVVHDVSLTVSRGEVHGLIGESGSGKTQTAWSILRLLPEGGRVVAGSIRFGGEDLAKASERTMVGLRGSRIAYIPQEPMSNLDPSFTIGSQLVEPLRVKQGLSKEDAKKKAIGLLARVGIPNPERTFAAYPHEVSGGMAQRVLIAGAVSCEPDLLIADEPTTALDVTVQAEVLDLLRDLQREFDMGVVLVTHNFGVVADLCDRVSVMKQGRIVETGPVRSIFADPRHPYTKSLFDAILEDSEPRGALAGVTSSGTVGEGTLV